MKEEGGKKREREGKSREGGKKEEKERREGTLLLFKGTNQKVHIFCVHTTHQNLHMWPQLAIKTIWNTVLAGQPLTQLKNFITV